MPVACPWGARMTNSEGQVGLKWAIVIWSSCYFLLASCCHVKIWHSATRSSKVRIVDCYLVIHIKTKDIVRAKIKPCLQCLLQSAAIKVTQLQHLVLSDLLHSQFMFPGERIPLTQSVPRICSDSFSYDGRAESLSIGRLLGVCVGSSTFTYKKDPPQGKIIMTSTYSVLTMCQKVI